MSSLANIVLDIKTTNPSIKTDAIASVIATSVENNTIVNTIKTQLSASTNPTLTALSQSVAIDSSSLSVAKKIPPVFVGPASYASTEKINVFKGWFIGGDGTNKIIKSNDGTNWTAITQTALANQVDSFAFGNDSSGNEITVAVGAGGASVSYSTDLGNTWIRGNPASIHGAYGRDAIYGFDASNKPMWLSVGANVVPMAISYDGMNWTSKGATLAGTNVLRGIAFGNNQYLALGNNGINLSTDYGVSWTNVSSLVGQGRGAAYGIDKNGIGRWIAVGVGTASIAQSTNGASWTAIPNSTTYLTQGFKIAYGSDASGNYRWVLGGSGGQKMVYTDDGITFNSCNGTANITFVYNITFGQTANGLPLWIAAGYGDNNLLKSSDGITWTSFTDKTNLLSTNVNGAICLMRKYEKPIYLNYTPGKQSLYSSVDGSFSSMLLMSPFSTAINKIEWNGSMWVGVGEGTNTVAYSTNGIIWTGLGTTLFATKGTNVVWNASDNKWSIYGEGGAKSMFQSTNGIHWI